MLFTCFIGALLATFCMVLFMLNLRNVLQGLLNLDIKHRRKHRIIFGGEPLVWIPSLSEETTPKSHGDEFPESGRAIPMLPEERPYDLGWRSNVSVTWQTLREGLKEYALRVPELNPIMLKRMVAEASTVSSETPVDGERSQEASGSAIAGGSEFKSIWRQSGFAIPVNTDL